MALEKSLNSTYSGLKHSSLNSTSLELDFSTSFDNGPVPTLNKFHSDPDKLQILHTGSHGEQHGTLITRHYLRTDSKCIQCNSCGIFFTPTTFLLHSHDKYGKRIPCNAVQLQLNIEHPSIVEKQKWTEFQQKLHSANRSTPGFLVSPIKSQSNNLEHRRPMSEIGNQIKDQSKHISSDLSAFTRLKNYPSNSSVHLVNSHSSKFDKLLSLSDLKPEKLSNAIIESFNTKKSDFKENERDLSKFAPIIKSTPLASRTNFLKPIATDPPLRPHSRYRDFQPPRFPPADARNTQDKPLPTQNEFLPPSRVSTTSPHHPTSAFSSTNPLDMINQASQLLEKAKLNLINNKVAVQGPMSSSAWRKMYEEERDHRMQLEAKIRSLERQVHLRK